MARRILQTPPLPRLVPEGVFDAFGWCESDALEWVFSDAFSASARDGHTRVTAENPARMIFVLKRTCDFLPKELARLHVPELGFGDELALAPYAIDDATDELYAHDVEPKDLFSLAADSLPALVWGLHDWSHFHNHGPFERRAWTELQCDAAALAWLWINRSAAGLDEAAWERTRRDLALVGRGRFEVEGLPFDDAWIAAERLHALVEPGESRQKAPPSAAPAPSRPTLGVTRSADGEGGEAWPPVRTR